MSASKDLAKSGEFVFIKTNSGIKFIGKFDDLYMNMKDPWGQMEDDQYRQRRMTILKNLSHLNPASVLDVGCGLGHTTQAIKILITKDTWGADISKVAVNRAKKLFPDVTFKQLDISKKFLPRAFDVVVLDGILWYILKDLDKIFEIIRHNLSYSGHLVISQAFIKDQQYGKEFIDGYEGFIKYIYQHFSLYKLIKTEYFDIGERKTESITILQKRE